MVCVLLSDQLAHCVSVSASLTAADSNMQTLPQAHVYLTYAILQLVVMVVLVPAYLPTQVQLLLSVNTWLVTPTNQKPLSGHYTRINSPSNL